MKSLSVSDGVGKPKQVWRFAPPQNEIGVDHDHFLAVPRNGDAEATRDEALANAAFAAANRDDATFGGMRPLANGRSKGLDARAARERFRQKSQPHSRL